MERRIEQAFPAIEGTQVRALILGSMPSQKSLAIQQYYAHPQNAFWKIMTSLFCIRQEASYSERIEVMKHKDIGIWDVIKSCHRPGSMDADIASDTVVVNDFSAFFQNHPELTVVLFNGQAAAKTFHKHLGKSYLSQHNVSAEVLPSTSPAYASMSLEAKTEHWRNALDCML